MDPMDFYDDEEVDFVRHDDMSDFPYHDHYEHSTQKRAQGKRTLHFLS